MFGSSEFSSRKRVRLTVEVFEEEQEAVIRLLRETTRTVEVVSLKRVNYRSNAPKRFLLPHPQDEELPPTPVRLFPRRSEIAPGSNDSKNATDEAAEPVAACEYCLQARCITSSPFKPQGRSNARITNHTKRRKDYRWYWRTLKDCGLWENTIYLAHQQELGCLIDDVREVMPHCVIKDVRGRWPNPSDVPYQGHR